MIDAYKPLEKSGQHIDVDTQLGIRHALDYIAMALGELVRAQGPKSDFARAAEAMNDFVDHAKRAS